MEPQHSGGGLPIDLGDPRYGKVYKYFQKNSTQRLLSKLSKESVYEKGELRDARQWSSSNEELSTPRSRATTAATCKTRSSQRTGTAKSKASSSTSNISSFTPRREKTSNKEQLEFYLQEEKKRQLREMVTQAKVYRTIEREQRNENIKKKLLDQKLKEESYQKIKEFERNKRFRNSDKKVPVKRDGSETSRSSRGSRDSISTARSSRKPEEKPELPPETPRRPRNSDIIAYADYNGLPIPKDATVNDVSTRLIDKLSKEYKHDLSTSNIENGESKEEPSPRKKKVLIDENYLSKCSLQAVRKIAKAVESNKKSNFTPRDFSQLQKDYGVELQPNLSPRRPQREIIPFQKVKLTREIIRVPPHPPKVHKKEKLASNVKLVLRYTGVPTKAVGIPEEGHKLEIVHQPGGGTSMKIFDDYVYPGNVFEVVSRRLPGFPFSVTLYINGHADTRVSTCCEFRHKAGFKIGGKLGRFVVEKIIGDEDLKCYKCKVVERENMPKLKKLVVDRKKHEAEVEGADSLSSAGSETSISQISDSEDSQKLGSDSSSDSEEESALADKRGNSRAKSNSDGKASKSPQKPSRMTQNETLESNHSDHEDYISYKVNLLVKELQEAKQSDVVIKIVDGKKKEKYITTIEKPFSKLTKSNVITTFMGRKLDKVTECRISTIPEENHPWFLKEVTFDYEGQRTLFKCERWVGLADGEQVFKNGKTTMQSPRDQGADRRQQTADGGHRSDNELSPNDARFDTHGDHGRMSRRGSTMLSRRGSIMSDGTQEPGSARNDPGSARHDPGSARHDPGSARHDPGSARHDHGSSRLDPGMEHGLLTRRMSQRRGTIHLEHPPHPANDSSKS